MTSLTNICLLAGTLCVVHAGVFDQGCSLEVGEFILRPLKIAFVLKTEGVMDVNVTVDGELYPSYESETFLVFEEGGRKQVSLKGTCAGDVEVDGGRYEIDVPDAEACGSGEIQNFMRSSQAISGTLFCTSTWKEYGDVTHTTCSFDGKDPVPCESPVTLSSLNEQFCNGYHNVAIQAYCGDRKQSGPRIMKFIVFNGKPCPLGNGCNNLTFIKPPELTPSWKNTAIIDFEASEEVVCRCFIRNGKSRKKKICKNGRRLHNIFEDTKVAVRCYQSGCNNGIQYFL